MKRSAFTLMELIIVMVVAGILAAVMIPRLERDSLREAANQVVRHIQYTQHLAMMNDVYDATNPAVTTWYQNRWSIDLCQPAYKIKRAVTGGVAAEDPLTQRPIDGTDNNLADMGVGLSSPTTCIFVFDNLGRPYALSSGGVPGSPTGNLMGSNINVNLTANGRTAVITITKETGYVTLTSLN